MVLTLQGASGRMLKNRLHAVNVLQDWIPGSGENYLKIMHFNFLAVKLSRIS